MDQLQHLLTQSANEVWSFVLNFLVFLVITIVLFFFGVRYGRGRLTMLSIALYVGFALYSAFPYLSMITGMVSGALAVLIAKIIVYALLTYAAYYGMRRIGGADFFSAGKLSILVLSIVASGFIMAILYHTLGAKVAYPFTPALDQLFAPSKYFFWWFIAPLFGILIFSR